MPVPPSRVTRTARTAGIIGIVAAVVSWGAAVMLTQTAAYARWLAGGGLAMQVLYAVLSTGLPVLGGTLVAFWIVVAIWSRTRDPQDGAPTEAGDDRV